MIKIYLDADDFDVIEESIHPRWRFTSLEISERNIKLPDVVSTEEVFFVEKEQ